MLKTFVNSRVKLLEPSVNDSRLQLLYNSDLLIIINEDEFLENIYRRYCRVRLDALMEAAKILACCTNKSSALVLLKSRINRTVPHATENFEEMSDIYNSTLKSENLRKSKKGL